MTAGSGPGSRQGRAAVVGALLSALADPAGAAPEGLPPRVREEFTDRERTCREDQKGAAVFRPKYLQRIDLDGDGRLDFILDGRHYLCGGQVGECGSGGCNLTVLLATEADAKLVIGELADGFSLQRAGKGRILKIGVKGHSTVIRYRFEDGCVAEIGGQGIRNCGE